MLTTNLSIAGFGISAFAFLILVGLLMTAWRGSKEGMSLIVASIFSIVWASISGYQMWKGVPSSFSVVISEILRDISWLVFLLFVLSKVLNKNAIQSFLRIASILVVLNGAALLFLVTFSAFGYQIIPSSITFNVLIFLFLLFGLAGLVITEQIYRNAPLTSRWSIKYICIGLGGMFAYDFYLYADALLLKGFDGNIWAARGYINTIIVPLIAVSAARNPQWSLDIYVSRNFVFHGASVFGAGIYLVAMAAGGYYIKNFGGEWGSLAQLTFLFGAIILLVSLLFSGQLRAKLRVFLSKHFFNYRYDYREEWLRLMQTLSEARMGVGLNKAVINAMSRIVESPAGLLWLQQGEDNYQLVESRNLPKTIKSGTEDNASLIDFLKKKKWIIDLLEFDVEKESYPGLTLPKWINEYDTAWLIVPLFFSSGLEIRGQSKASTVESEVELLGFIMLARPNVKVQINWEVRDLLLTTGRQCAGYLALQKTNESLMEAKQFDAFNRLSAYVVHDLKNIVGQLELVVSNAERHRDNPEFVDDAFSTISNATTKMERLLAQLRKGRLDINDRPNQVDLDKLLATAVKDHSKMKPVPVYEHTGSTVAVLVNGDRLSAVVGHLIQNAQEATDENGSIVITLAEKQRWAVITIEDTGTGMDEEFVRNSLFRPFKTTKGNAGMGIGVYESRQFLLSIGGRLEVSSLPGKGTTFSLFLPITQSENKVGSSDTPLEISIRSLMI